MNKQQEFFVDNTLEQIEEEFNKLNKKLKALNKDNNKAREKLFDEIARTVLKYDVKNEKMNINAKDKKKILDKLNSLVGDLVENEYKVEKEFIEDNLKEATKKVYEYRSYLYSLGMDFNIEILTDKEILKIVNSKVDNKIWSNRLWKNKKSRLQGHLRYKIKDLLNGKESINTISKNLQLVFNSDKYITDRLVRTETCRVQQEALEIFDKQHGIEKQLFIATLDKKTSNVCQKHDGKIFNVDDKDKPIPPLHPYCRSVLCGIPSEDYKPRTRRNNENMEIIDYIKYKDFYENN